MEMHHQQGFSIEFSLKSFKKFTKKKTTTSIDIIFEKYLKKCDRSLIE